MRVRPVIIALFLSLAGCGQANSSFRDYHTADPAPHYVLITECFLDQSRACNCVQDTEYWPPNQTALTQPVVRCTLQ